MHLVFFVGLCSVSLVSSQSFSFGIGFDNASPSATSSGFPFQTTAFEPQRSQTNSRGASRKASGSASRPRGNRQSNQDIKESISSFIFSGLEDNPALTSARQSTSQRSRGQQPQQQQQQQQQPQQQPQQQQQTPTAQEQTLPEVNSQRPTSVRTRQQALRLNSATFQPQHQQQVQQSPHAQQQQEQLQQLQLLQQQQQQQQKEQLQQQKEQLQQQIQRQQNPQTKRQQQQQLQQNFQPQQFEEISRIPTDQNREVQRPSSLSDPIPSTPVQEVNEVNIGKSPCARGLPGLECRTHLKTTALACTSGKCHQCQQCGSVLVNDWIQCCRDHFLCCRPLARSCQRCDQPLLTSFCNIAFGKCK